MPHLSQVDHEHPWLVGFRNGPIPSRGTGMCVASILFAADGFRPPVPTFGGGTSDDPNNPRGAMVLLMKAGNWVSIELPGSQEQSINSPYGTTRVWVTGRDAYVAQWGHLPNGALVFQTRHGWGYNDGSSGNDLATIRERGRAVINYAPMGGLVYGDATRDIVVCVPAGAIRK
jgi:hypothetical protein